MGERYQIHLRFETEEAVKQYSIHLQWCWDAHIIRNLHRLLTTLSKTESGYPDFEALGSYSKSILEVNRSTDGHYYPYRIHLEEYPYATFEGDNNHGWCVILVKTEKNKKFKVFSRFYDRTGNPKSNEELWEDGLKQLESDEDDDKEINKFKKLLDAKLFNNTDLDLQKLFNKEARKLEKKRKEDYKEYGYYISPVFRVKAKTEHKATEIVEREVEKTALGRIHRWRY